MIKYIKISLVLSGKQLLIVAVLIILPLFAFPHYGASGISLNYTEELTIGDANETVNSFDNLTFGIYAHNANFNSFNNTFTAIEQYNPTKSGMCIFAYSDFDANDRTVNIGGSGADKNVFTLSDNGIILSGEMNSNIGNNVFGTGPTLPANGMTTYTILAKNFNNKKVAITDNTIYDFNLGIFATGVGQLSDLQINYNTLIQSKLFSNSYNGTGISVQSPIYNFKVSKKYILGNKISRARIGIHLLNMINVQVGDVNTNEGNEIHYNIGSGQAPSTFHAGIWLEHTHAISVFSNIIDNSSVLTSATNNFRGMEVENSTGCWINCNQITNINFPFYFKGLCNQTLLRVNEMTEYVNAVFKDNATVSRQGHFVSGTTYEPLNNEWYDATPSNRVDGNIGIPTKWDYDNNNPAKYKPTPADLTEVDPELGGTVTVVCNTIGLRPPRVDMLGRIVGDSLEYSDFIDENTYLEKMNAYCEMLEDSTLLTEGNEHEDSVYQAFFDTLSSSNIGTFFAINNLLSDGSYADYAAELNEAIDDTNDIEYFKKNVNTVYLNTLARNIALNESDSADLDYVSDLSWVEAGDAIYMAAAMIGKEIHPNIPSGHRISNFPLQSDIAYTELISLQPNPAKNYFLINAVDAQLKSIYIYDVQGQLLFQSTLKDDVISCSALQSGIYTVKLVDENDKKYYKKISIIK